MKIATIVKLSAVAIVLIGAVVGISKLGKWLDKPTVSNNAIVVTPVSITPAVSHALPAGQTGHTQVNIPPVVVHPGLIPTQHVVVTDQGNTVVVTTEKMDIGFPNQPVAFIGYDTDVFAGIGLNVARFWRFNADILTSYGFKQSTIRIGGAITFAVDSYVKVGVTYQLGTDSQQRAGIGVAFSL
jgi:hypothetical protein